MFEEQILKKALWVVEITTGPTEKEIFTALAKDLVGAPAPLKQELVRVLHDGCNGLHQCAVTRAQQEFHFVVKDQSLVVLCRIGRLALVVIDP